MRMRRNLMNWWRKKCGLHAQRAIRQLNWPKVVIIWYACKLSPVSHVSTSRIINHSQQPNFTTTDNCSCKKEFCYVCKRDWRGTCPCPPWSKVKEQRGQPAITVLPT